MPNGNFQAGNTAFTSSYSYTAQFTPGDLGEAHYTVSTSAHDVHSAFANFFDHTFGSAAGLYMTVNGAGTAGVPVYTSSPIAVHGGRYNFSAWLSSVYLQSPAQLAFTVTPNVGPAFSVGTFNAPSTVAVWNQVGANFGLAPTVTSITLSLVNRNTDLSGNDFGIDDITLNAVPEPATWAMMVAGFGLVGAAVRRRTLPPPPEASTGRSKGRRGQPRRPFRLAGRGASSVPRARRRAISPASIRRGSGGARCRP